MKLPGKQIIGTLLLLFTCFVLVAQQQFREEIEAFRTRDAASPPAKGSIVFTGSSSFRFWKNIKSDFTGYPIINTGFGGSNINDVIYYAEDVILKYEPRQVVIYCGENDLAQGATPQEVLNRFDSLFKIIRNQIPHARITFVSIKPSPSRAHIISEVTTANALIKDYLSCQTNTDFVNIFDEMTSEDGSPRKELFIEDRLHMNLQGYSIWTKIIKPYLKK